MVALPAPPSGLPGWFLVFEGADGSGKTTQLYRAAQYLQERLSPAGRQVILTREPGGTPLGERLREILLSSEGEPPSPLTESLLMVAARAHHVQKVLRPALEAGHIVLCDRYSPSTLAYQGYGRGVPLEDLQHLVSIAQQGISPDAVLCYDVPYEVTQERLRARQNLEPPSRFDLEAQRFKEAVARGFRSLSGVPGYYLIPGAESLDAVWKNTRTIIDGLLFPASRQG